MAQPAQTAPNPREGAGPTARKLDDVPGWFWPIDQQLFGWLLDRQSDLEITGDLLELGPYLGRSAILIGWHVRPGETFTVVDIFEDEAPDASNTNEVARSYGTRLTRARFEANYLDFHSQLPVIIQAPTSDLADGRIPAGSCRFVHIDASHLYDHVVIDAQVARAALGPSGIVVFDDYRQPHTPGVAAAAWGAVLNLGLNLICSTDQKLYGTWGSPTAIQDDLLKLDGDRDKCRMDIESVAGQRLIRLSGPGVAGLMPASVAAQPAAPVRRPGRARRLAVDLLPPVVTRAIRRGRKPARN